MTRNYRPVHSTDRGALSRGFTLVELMVVVVIITGLAALAVPSIVKQMRDRRTRQAAEEIASIYRQARLRALGRGSAVMVRYASATGFQMREALLSGNDPACARLPVTSCSTTQWGTTTTYTLGDPDQFIGQFNPVGGVYAGVTVAVYASGQNSTGNSGIGNATDPTTTVLDICFTPMGRTLYRKDNGTLFPMTGVPLVTVSRDTGGLKRQVVIPPNGLARTDVAQ